jgi:hypothetical protein
MAIQLWTSLSLIHGPAETTPEGGEEDKGAAFSTFIRAMLTAAATGYTPPWLLTVIDCPALDTTTPPFSKTSFQPSSSRALIYIKFLSKPGTYQTSSKVT